MPKLGFSYAKQGDLRAAFGDMDDRSREYLRDGLKVIAALDDAKWSVLTKAVASFSAQPSDLEIAYATRATGLSLLDFQLALGVIRLAYASLFSRRDPREAFLDFLKESSILERETEARIAAFTDLLISEFSALDRTLEQTSLQTDALPTLDEIDFSVELRLNFTGDNQVAEVAPIVVVHLDTDVNNREIWFQMTPYQVDALIAGLQEIQGQLVAAESFAKGIVKK